MPEWEEVTGQGAFWKPQGPNDVLEGKVIKVRTTTYGLTLDIETKEGMKSTPAHVVLQGMLENVRQDEYIKITYLGKKKGKRYGQYKVQRRK
jgi:hypothetical protein